MGNDSQWWRSAVVYQIYPRSLQDSNDDGVGDLNGIAQRLDDLVELGVDALWLSPVQRSPMVDFGYDVSDYRDIDPLFGTLADFDRLLEQAHAKGLKVLLDIVVNHSSDQHPWFQESRSSRDNPKRDWYLWHDGPRPPNNWQGVFGGRAWSRDPQTQSWYLHSFLPQQPDLNWRNPELRKAVFDDLEFWLKRGVDGFRFDVFNLWYKHPELKSNPIKWWGWRNPRPYDWQWHRYDGFHSDLHHTLGQLRQLLDRYNAVSVGETYCPDGWDPNLAASYLGVNDRMHLAFDFSTMVVPWSARAFGQVLSRAQNAAAEPNWPCVVFSNHDQPRSWSRFGRGVSTEAAEARARIVAAVLLLTRGTPFLYAGEELGLPQVKLKRREIRDPVGLKYWPVNSGRDGARTPLAWDDSPHGGFTKASPWLPLHPEYPQRNVAAQKKDAHSLWNWYRRLLVLRRSFPALHRGTWEAVEVGHPDVLAFRRRGNEGVFLVMAHFGTKPAPILLDRAGTWVFGTHERSQMEPGLHVLSAYEVAIIRDGAEDKLL